MNFLHDIAKSILQICFIFLFFLVFVIYATEFIAQFYQGSAHLVGLYETSLFSNRYKYSSKVILNSEEKLNVREQTPICFTGNHEHFIKDLSDMELCEFVLPGIDDSNIPKFGGRVVDIIGETIRFNVPLKDGRLDIIEQYSLKEIYPGHYENQLWQYYIPARYVFSFSSKKNGPFRTTWSDVFCNEQYVNKSVKDISLILAIAETKIALAFLREKSKNRNFSWIDHNVVENSNFWGDKLCERLTHNIRHEKNHCSIYWDNNNSQEIGGFLINRNSFEIRLNLPDYNNKEKNMLKNRPEITAINCVENIDGDGLIHCNHKFWSQNPLNW